MVSSSLVLMVSFYRSTVRGSLRPNYCGMDVTPAFLPDCDAAAGALSFQSVEYYYMAVVRRLLVSSIEYRGVVPEAGRCKRGTVVSANP
jgi:hypothetical protein